MKRELTLFTALAGVALLPAAPLYAADADNNATQVAASAPLPDIEIRGKETFSYDSNPLMMATGAQGLFGSVTEPELILRRTTPTMTFSADTRLDENLYNHSDFNSTDAHEKLDFTRQMEQWGAGVKAGADYDTVRTSELTTFGLNLPSVRHTGLSVTPDISYKFSALDSIELDGSAMRSTYDNTALVDYDVFSASPSYTHAFDPSNQGVLAIQAQRYQALDGSKERVDSVGPQASWIAALTPRWSTKLTAGVQRSWQSATATADATSYWNYIFGADLRFKGQQDQTVLSATRSQFPFSNGTETLLTTFSATENHDLNDLVSLNAAGNYEFAKAPPASSGVNLDREFGGGAGATYHVSEHWDATASYQYRNETLTGISGNITDNTVMLGIAYHPFTVTPLNHDE